MHLKKSVAVGIQIAFGSRRMILKPVKFLLKRGFQRRDGCFVQVECRFLNVQVFFPSSLAVNDKFIKSITAFFDFVNSYVPK